MANFQNDEPSFRAQKALNSIHEAREAADDAFDELMMTHQRNAPEDAKSDAEQDLHVAVMMLYNRLRPYLNHVPEIAHQRPLHIERDENGQPITETVQNEDGSTEEVPQGIFGLFSLDAWRLATTTVSQRQERLGGPDQEEETEQPIHMPTDIAVEAYDALQEALVELDFAAEPGSDVPLTDLDDAPDQPGQFGQQPEMARTDGGHQAGGDE
jgi:hypothetical protein